MQYILTEDEMNDLNTHRDNVVKDLREALVFMRRRLLKATGFTCVHDRKNPHMYHCDDCPCSCISYSSSYINTTLLCDLKQRFSK